MGLFNGFKNLFKFGYQGAESTPRRKAPVATLRSEDDELWQYKRSLLVSTTRDLIRNFAAAKWSIGKHLDYVSTYTFQSRSGDDAFDAQFERLMNWWAEPQNCDVAGRHDFYRYIRIMESRAVVDGDIFIVKLATGELQAIEGDRVRTPYSITDVPIPNGGTLINGVVVDAAGRMMGIVICKRQQLNRFGGDAAGIGNGNFEFERYIPAENVIHHGYFDRFDQIRGISPLASGLNAFRDVMEASEYALIKAKIISLFGIKFTRNSTEELPGSTNVGDEDNTGYTVDFGQGAFALDMQPGDNAEFMESGHPSTQFQDYMNQSLSIALKSLDIPFSFYNESFTNYSGARQAWIQYNQSANVKRDQLKRVLNSITKWKLNTWIATGLITIPSGMQFYDLNWEWVAAGVPWIDPLKEVQANIAAINAGLDSRSRICKEMGVDFQDVVKDLEKEQKLLVAAGLNPLATPVPITITEVSNSN